RTQQEWYNRPFFLSFQLLDNGYGYLFRTIATAEVNRGDTARIGAINSGVQRFSGIFKRLRVLSRAKPFKHHGGGKQHRGWICLAASRNIGCTAVARLE